MKALRVLLLISSLTISSALHARCDFLPVQTVPKVRAIVDARGGWPVSDERCNYLNTLLGQRNLSIYVVGSTAVFSGVSVGWATVTLIENTTNIVSDSLRLNTAINSPNPVDAADALYGAITTAINEFNYTKGAQEIETYKTKK